MKKYLHPLCCSLLVALAFSQASCLGPGGPLGGAINLNGFGMNGLSMRIPSSGGWGGFGSGRIYSDTPPWPGAIEYHDYYPTRYRNRTYKKPEPLTAAQKAHNQKAWENAARIWNAMPEPNFQGESPGAWRGRMFRGVP